MTSSSNLASLQKPFWIWDKKEHLALAKEKERIMLLESCCRLVIEGKEYLLFVYEKILFNSLIYREANNLPGYDFKHKHLWVLKATAGYYRVIS